MKKKLFMLLLAGCATLAANAQYQVANSGFENWEAVEYKKTLSTVKGEEPLSWNSFITGTGNFKSVAAANQLEQTTDKRPGSSGSKSARVYARSVIGQLAQGTLTTGCLNMGSTTATDANGNYTYTNLDNGQNQKFTGRPDAMHVWVKYISSQTTYKAKASALLHTEGYYQDPYGNSSSITAELVAAATKTDIASSSSWQELTIPCVYESKYATEGRPAYALITFSTSSTPGKGDKDDQMYVDDLEFIYYSQLSDLKFNGATLAGFNKDTYAYEVEGMYTEGCLTYTSNGVGATVSESYNAATKIATITVKGDDISVNASNYHTYTVKFNTPTYDYADGSAFAVAPGVYNVKINRTFNAGWSTICLPFATTTSALGAGVKAQALSSASETTLSFTGTETLEANKPYLVYFPSVVNSLSFTEVTVEEQAPVAVTFGAWTFEGTYAASKPMSGLYGVAKQNGEDKILMGGTSAKMKATRAFFSTTAANVKEMGIELDGVVTAIDNVEMAGKKTFDVYSVSGALMRQGATSLNGLHSGLYIINGKKVLVK